MCLQPDLHEALFYSSQLVAGAKTEGTTNCVWNHLLTQAIKHLHTQNQVQVANCTRKQVIAGAISCKCNFSPETNCSQSKEMGIRNSAPNVCVVIATTCDFNRLPPPGFKCNGLALVFMNSQIACSFCVLLCGNPFFNLALFSLSRRLSSELSSYPFFKKLSPFGQEFMYCSTVPNGNLSDLIEKWQ